MVGTWTNNKAIHRQRYIDSYWGIHRSSGKWQCLILLVGLQSGSILRYTVHDQPKKRVCPHMLTSIGIVTIHKTREREREKRRWRKIPDSLFFCFTMSRCINACCWRSQDVKHDWSRSTWWWYTDICIPAHVSPFFMPLSVWVIWCLSHNFLWVLDGWTGLG